MSNLEKVYLAPMDGVCDPPMRKVLTHYGKYDECFSEFIRVTTEVLPYKTLLREVPELQNDCCTDYGCLCRVQLLGDEPEPVAQTALRAVELGAKGIDLNFGCPSRFVHHGGAMLLKEPELIHEIVARTRDALDGSIFLSVKFRLGFLSADELPEIVKAVAVPGVNELIIHARTRKDLYKKDALNWPAIAPVVDSDLALHIPVVANGDITSLASSQECFQQTGAKRQMVGRAAIATPNLPQVLREQEEPMPLPEVLAVALEFASELQSRNVPEKSVLDRLKQFMGYAHKYDERLSEFFKVFCRSQQLLEAQNLLEKAQREMA